MACQNVWRGLATMADGRAKARRGEVNPKPKICCGRYISRTHCHRDAAVESASEERQLEREAERERESDRDAQHFQIEMSFRLALEFFIANFWAQTEHTVAGRRETREGEEGGMGVRTPLGRSCQGLPYFCHISREPTQMSHQSCDQCCVRSKENIHFALPPKNESTFALDLGFPCPLSPLSRCCMRND